MANNPDLSQQSLSDGEEHGTADWKRLEFIPKALTKEGYEFILASNMKYCGGRSPPNTGIPPGQNLMQYSQSVKQEAREGMANAGTVNVTPPEEKEQEIEPLVYATKQEAEDAFKALLESVNVHADWTWEQAMEVIIADKKYAAGLMTRDEQMQAFYEYVDQRRRRQKHEAEKST